MEKPLLLKAMDLLMDTVCVVDADGRYIYVSASCEQLLGYTPAELLGRRMIDLVHPEDRERTLATAAAIMAGAPTTHFENRYIRKDGRVVDIMWSARWLADERVRVAVARDVTPLKRAERMRDALYRISEAGHATEGLPALCEHIHRILDDLLPIGHFCVALLDRDSGELTLPYCVGEPAPDGRRQRLEPDTPIARVIDSGSTVLTTARSTPRPTADEAKHDWLGVPLIAPDGVMGALVTQADPAQPGYGPADRELLEFVSTQIATAIERKRAEERLRHMAGHDALTDLPNRVLFHDRLEVAMGRAHRNRECLALLYLDLDDFKQVNDRHGHEAGDALLCDVARRLLACVRETDTVVRMGGDEFVVLLPDIRTPANLPGIIESVRESLNRPFRVNGQDLRIAVSIGAALYPDHGQDRDQLLRHADTDMYQKKQWWATTERDRET